VPRGLGEARAAASVVWGLGLEAFKFLKGLSRQLVGKLFFQEAHPFE